MGSIKKKVRSKEIKKASSKQNVVDLTQNKKQEQSEENTNVAQNEQIASNQVIDLTGNRVSAPSTTSNSVNNIDSIKKVQIEEEQNENKKLLEELQSMGFEKNLIQWIIGQNPKEQNVNTLIDLIM